MRPSISRFFKYGLRGKLAFSILVVFIVWPFVQISWCCSTGGSSWRFAGWGMYATPHPICNQSITIWKSAGFPANVAVMPFRRTRLYLRGDMAERFCSQRPTPKVVKIVFERTITFRSHKDIALIADMAQTLMGTKTDVSVAVSQLRYDVTRDKFYTTSDVFHVSKGRVSFSRRQSSLQLEAY